MEKYIIYYGIIIVASIFAWLSQKYAKNKENEFKLNKVFFWLSIVTLTIMMGFRVSGVGVDDGVYKEIFYKVNKDGIWQEFIDSKTESGYLLLNQFVGLFTDNFQVIIFLTSIIPIILFYKAIQYERKKVNLFLAVFLFGTVMYLYFYGIIRLFIAASIITYSYRYIFEKKTKKFLICVLIASIFHRSALFMLCFLYFTTEKEGKPRSKKKFIILTSIAIFLATVLFTNVIIPALGNSKYAEYTINYNFSLSISDCSKIFLVLLVLFFRKHLKKENNRIDMYIVMLIIASVITLYSNFSYIGRLQWYMMFSLCIILPTIVRVFYKSKYKYLNVILIPVILFYGVIYSYQIISSESRFQGMSNYRNILFENKE